MHNKIFISADFEAKIFGRKSEKSAKNFWLKISQNENFIIQSGYGEHTLVPFFKKIQQYFCLKINQNENFIMQSGYEEQTL